MRKGGTRKKRHLIKMPRPLWERMGHRVSLFQGSLFLWIFFQKLLSAV
jgi:hypothetical protein